MVQSHNAQNPENIYRVGMRNVSPEVVNAKSNTVYPKQYSIFKPNVMPSTPVNSYSGTNKSAPTAQINTPNVLRSLFQ